MVRFTPIFLTFHAGEVRCSSARFDLKAHTENESVGKRELAAAVEIYARLARTLLAGESNAGKVRASKVREGAAR